MLLGRDVAEVGVLVRAAERQVCVAFDQAGHHFADHGIGLSNLSIDIKKMLGRKDTVVKLNNDGILYLFKKNKVAFFHGRGSFSKAVDGGYEVELVAGEEGVSPGQACVFYDAPAGQARVLGGGFIKSATARHAARAGGQESPAPLAEVMRG